MSSHKPMVRSEQPIKSRTLDRLHKAEHAQRDTKPLPSSQLTRIPPIGPVRSSRSKA